MVFCVEAVHRHFESRRRMFNDSQPHRLSIKESNDKKTKLCNRQKQVIVFSTSAYIGTAIFTNNLFCSYIADA